MVRLRTTTTPGEVFIRWDDVPTKCVGTYELFYHKTPGQLQRSTTAGAAATGAAAGRAAASTSASASDRDAASDLEGSSGNVNIIPSETLFSAFVHQQAGTVAVGCYAVRWTDIWGQASPMSAEVCLKTGEGEPRQYINA